MLLRTAALLAVCLLGACAPAALSPNEFTNEDPTQLAQAVVSGGQWEISDRHLAAHFDIPIKDLNRFSQRKSKFKIVSVNAPQDWNVDLKTASLHRENISESSGNTTFADYVDLTFAVDVPDGFEGLTEIEAIVAFGDGPEREVVLLLGSDQGYLDFIDAPEELIG